MNKTAIKTTGITKSFGSKTVLNGINLELGSGEIFGLLGPSGAGKTTLIKILTGQLQPDSGEAYINGADSRHLTKDDYKKYGIMMDELGVYDRLTCFENLKLFARIYGMKNSDISSALAKAGLAGEEKTPADRLSKGMKNRLRLARVFLTDPAIMFLDEPTSGLDPATAAGIHSLLLEEKKRGKTIFLTTHTMTEAEKLCDRVALLCEGHIIESGAPSEICRRHYSRKTLVLHLTDGSDCELVHGARDADRLAGLLGSGAVETIHSTEPDLETVFMKLTGKELSA